jgi:hypothetical protein
MKSIPILKMLGTAAFVAVLSGCAGTYVLDNTVQSFSQLTAAPAPLTYRFERLPSQQQADQAQLEALADAALHQAGFQRDDANPRYSVQIGARVQEVISPFADPWDGWGIGAGRRWHRRFGVWGPSYEPPWYHREVSIVVRELAGGRVVYETRASNAGPYSGNAVVFPAMFQAAMQGFPAPPPGPRVVNIQLPG